MPMTFDELVQMGLQLRENADSMNWELGDLADVASQMLEAKEFPKFAKSIGVPVPTLKRCRDVARAYAPEIRAEYAYLSWSHFRRVAALENRVEWLAKAADNNWSAEKMYLAAKGNLTVDETKDIPARPEMIWCETCKKWAFKYLDDYAKICPRQARCGESSEEKPNS